LTAFYDASVFVPIGFRNLLIASRTDGLFRAGVVGRVHEEWIARCCARRPDLSREKLERTRRLMIFTQRAHWLTGYET